MPLTQVDLHSCLLFSAGVNNTAMGTLSNKQVVTIGSTTITAVGASTVDVQDEGDRDEADGEDEKMDVPDEDEV